MLSIECRSHAFHVLFDDVSYDIRSMHWHVNNKIKRKFTLSSVNTIKTFISCIVNSRYLKTFKFSLVLQTRENIHVFFTLDEHIYGIHSKTVNILYIYIYLLFGRTATCFLITFFFNRSVLHIVG